MARTNQNNQPTATPSTHEHLSKYARKQQRLREEKDFWISYEVKEEDAEEPKEAKTLAEMVEEGEIRLTDGVARAKKAKAVKDATTEEEDDEENSQRNRWSRLPKEEKDRLVEKWEKEVQSYLDACAIMQSKIDKLKTAIGGFHALIKRNHKRIKEIRREGEK